ncbi:ribonuclease III domain-containing protein [Prochlorothrix hollandica]|uniref:ribonuclease III domain-containing protein n=1 Tax=Prochlorothrix hollandica TaxID=1223 RepID=UPI00333EF8F4
MSLEQKLGYFFFDKNHLKRALYHPSFEGETELPEPPFDQVAYGVLGRSLLAAVVTEFALRSGCDTIETIAHQGAQILEPQRLQALQEDLCLEFYVKLSPAAKADGQSQDPTVLQETFEALVAAVYLDGGYSSMRRIVKHLLVDPVLGPTEAG